MFKAPYVKMVAIKVSLCVGKGNKTKNIWHDYILWKYITYKMNNVLPSTIQNEIIAFLFISQKRFRFVKNIIKSLK